MKLPAYQKTLPSFDDVGGSPHLSEAAQCVDCASQCHPLVEHLRGFINQHHGPSSSTTLTTIGCHVCLVRAKSSRPRSLDLCCCIWWYFERMDTKDEGQVPGDDAFEPKLAVPAWTASVTPRIIFRGADAFYRKWSLIDGHLSQSHWTIQCIRPSIQTT